MPRRLVIGKVCTGIPASLYLAINGPFSRMHTTETEKRRGSNRSAVRTAFNSVPPTCMLSIQYTTRIGSPDDLTAKVPRGRDVVRDRRPTAAYAPTEWPPAREVRVVTRQCNSDAASLAGWHGDAGRKLATRWRSGAPPDRRSSPERGVGNPVPRRRAHSSV